MKKLLFILLSCTLSGIAMSCSDNDEQFVLRFDSSLVSPAEDFTDPRDQKVYPCVRIGNQIWMTRNLCYQVPCNSFKDASLGMKHIRIWRELKSNLK